MSSSGGTTGAPLSTTTVITTTEEYNLLPLESWRQSISYHPWHFWGLANSGRVPVSSSCNAIVTQHAWQQADAVGRQEIVDAIIEAEARLREQMNFSVGRRWIIETLQFPRPRAYGHQFAGSVSGDGRWLNIRATEGMIRAMGVGTYTAIDTAASVTYSDEDGDGLSETFTITVATSLTDPEEIGVYFASGDRLDSEPVSERWRINPVRVQIDEDAGVATIRGRSWMLVRPILYEGVNADLTNGIDPETSGNFVSTVAVYRKYTNPDGNTNSTSQALLVWETEPYPAWAIGCTDSDSLSFSTNSRDPAAVAYAIARAGIRDARLGEVTVGRSSYNATTGEWTAISWNTCRQPDRVTLRYEAGARLASVEETINQSGIDGRWDRIVARFAAAELNRRICACDTANRELYRWQHDPNLDNGARQIEPTPFGTRAGAVYAWDRVKNLNTTLGITLG